MRNYRVEWAEGEIEASALLDAIDELRADRATLQQMAYCLKDRLEAAEKERDGIAQQFMLTEIGKREISEAHNAVTRQLSVLADENTALRAKISEMERQEPVAEIVSFGGSDLKEVAWKKGKMPALGSKLYDLPGAQPAP